MKEIICGKNAVLEILRSQKRKAHKVFLSNTMNKTDFDLINAECEKRKIKASVVERDEIFNLSRIEKNQGVAVEVDKFEYTPFEEMVKNALADEAGAFIVILDNIMDPQNLGALIRTAYQCGAHGLIMPKDRAAPIGPAATRAASGATEYLPIAQVVNLSNAINYLKERNIWVIGADMDGHESVYSFDFSDSYAIVLGSEGEGMRRLVKERCDVILSIPMEGRIDSFNVSVAGAIFMSQVHRQRWLKRHAKNIP